MLTTIRLALLAAILGGATAVSSTHAASSDRHPPSWPQFRGPNASGIPVDDKAAAVEFGSHKGMLWRTELPVGHSSPCIWGERIFMTGFRTNDQKLATVCLDRSSGKVLWRQEVPAEKIEWINQWMSPNNPAAPTPATDGQRVVAYFGSFGLIAYDFEGKTLWEKRLPTGKSMHGTGSSPIIVNEFVLLDQHLTSDPCFLALRVADGTEAWKVSKPAITRGWSTPVVWREGEEDLVGLLTPGQFTAHRLKDGTEKWWVSGLANETCSTPVLGDGRLFFYVTHELGDSDNVVPVPIFDEMLGKYDKDKDGLLVMDEIPEDLMMVDRRFTGAGLKVGNFPMRMVLFSGPKGKEVKLDQTAWSQKTGDFAQFLGNVSKGEPRALGVRCGGTGDVTASHVLWSEKKGLPQVASALLYRNRLYFVKNDGLITCREPETGRLIYQERLGAPGGYYASLVAAGGNIYAASDRGVVTVFQAGDSLTVLARNEFEEPISATPAIVDGCIYVRTAKGLYAFARPGD